MTVDMCSRSGEEKTRYELNFPEFASRVKISKAAEFTMSSPRASPSRIRCITLNNANSNK